MEIAIGAIGAILGGIIATIVANYIWKIIDSRIIIKQITNPKDKDINQLIELYGEIFPDGFNVEEQFEYIQLSLLKSDKRPIEVDDIWLIAKRGRNVVGFFFCHYYPKRNKAWVSYYGVDKPKELPKDAISSKLVEKVLSYLKKRECEYLFFDVQRPQKNIKSKENTEKKSRIRLFKKDARINDVKALELKFDYKAPKISISAPSNSQLTLMIIPLTGKLEIPVPQKTIIEFLDFIYMDCYGDLYEKDDSRYEKFNKHLHIKLEEMKKEVPELVEVE